MVPTFAAGDIIWEVQTFDDDPTRFGLARWVVAETSRPDDGAVRVVDIPGRLRVDNTGNYRRIERLYRDLPTALAALARQANEAVRPARRYRRAP